MDALLERRIGLQIEFDLPQDPLLVFGQWHTVIIAGFARCLNATGSIGFGPPIVVRNQIGAPLLGAAPHHP